MKADDVRGLPWVMVTNWSGLPASLSNRDGSELVRSSDISGFVENIFRDVARKLGIPYEDLHPILMDENSSFFSLKKRLYTSYSGYSKRHPQLLELESMLRIPDVSFVMKSHSADKVEACVGLFESLTDAQKLEFLRYIGQIRINIEYLTPDG